MFQLYKIIHSLNFTKLIISRIQYCPGLVKEQFVLKVLHFEYDNLDYLQFPFTMSA